MGLPVYFRQPRYLKYKKSFGKVMLNIFSITRYVLFPVFMVILCLPSGKILAHTEGAWNDFMIDNKNDTAAVTLAYVRKQIADLALGKKRVSNWPDPVLMQLKRDLLVLIEEYEYMLNHLQEADGIHIQIKRTLLENPRAGRSVAASYAVELALELVEHIASQEDQFAFKRELNVDGKGAYIFDLMESYTDSMAVYKSLQQKTIENIDKQFIINALSNRTVWQDIKFHMGRFFRWIGQEDLAKSLQLMEISR